MESLMIDDISLDQSQSRVTVLGVPNQPGIAAGLFERVAKDGIFVDMIVQSYASEDFADISFTVQREQFDKSVEVAKRISDDFGCSGVEHKEMIAKLAVSGIGLRSHTAVALGMFRALADAAINVDMINTSEVRVTVVVDGSEGVRSLDCLRDEFSMALN